MDAHRDRFGVEPICRVLQVAPSSYYAAKGRQPCQRRLRDEAVKTAVARVHVANYGVYGARKVWRQLHRDGVGVARCTVERLMRQMGLAAAPVAPSDGPRSPPTAQAPSPIWSSAASSPTLPTSCGSPTSSATTRSWTVR